METITIKDKTFAVSIPADVIQSRISELARRISVDFADKNPFFVVVLNGGFLFAADIFRNISSPCEIGFIRVASYAGIHSTGQIKSILGLENDISGRHVILLEDIVDSGETAVFLMEQIRAKNPASVRFATLLFKPNALKHDFMPDYVGFEVPNDFLVGYGLDYDGHGRNHNAIYKLSS
jgi:hypoxanthine phosphoribosyltransferase